MFLWVSIVLRELEELVVTGISGASIIDLLKSLPVELIELYKHIIQRLRTQSPQIQKRAKKMLVWATFAERSMTLDEFGEAVIIPSDPEPCVLQNQFLSEQRILLLEPLIMNCCGGLLEVNDAITRHNRASRRSLIF